MPKLSRVSNLSVINVSTFFETKLRDYGLRVVQGNHYYMI
jgi:hypothetical protein